VEPTPPINRVDRKKEETRLKIIAVATGLFKAHGFDAVTMERIAAEADIAKGTLYNYFPVKEAIVGEYIRRTFAGRFGERVAMLRIMPDTRSRLAWVLTEIHRGIAAQPDIFEKYFVYHIHNTLSLRREAGIESGFRQLTAEIAALGRQSAELRGDLPDASLVALFEFAIIQVAQEYYQSPGQFRADETIGRCVDLCLAGARTNPGR
jgi:AcrR family transcriptional regulator